MKNDVCNQKVGSPNISHTPHTSIVAKIVKKSRKSAQFSTVFGRKVAVRGSNDKK